MTKEKPEPLKDKGVELNINTKTLHDVWHGFFHGDVKSAVEWLKSMLRGVMAQHEAIFLTPQFATEENKRIASAHINSYKHALKRIDEAFPDLCPSGDLIADKQNPQDNDNKKIVAD